MPVSEAQIIATPEQIFHLARLSDQDLLLHAKADLLTSLAVDVFSLRDLPIAIGKLSQLIQTIRVFREKTAKAAGAKLAPIVKGMFNDGGDEFCRKISYCSRRGDLRAGLAKIRNTIEVSKVLAELAELGDVLTAMADLLANLKLPLSVIFLIMLYTLDDVCKCG